MRQLIASATSRSLATARAIAANRAVAGSRSAASLPGGAAPGSVGTPDAVTLTAFSITVTDLGGGGRLVTVSTTLTDPNGPGIVSGYELEITPPGGSPEPLLTGAGIQYTFPWDDAPLTGTYSVVARAWNSTGYSLDSNTLTADPSAAIGTPTLIGSAQETGFPNTTIAVAVPAGGVAQNARIVVAFARGSIAGTPTCADSRGNTYTLHESLDNAVQGIYLFSANAATALLEADTITVTYTAGSGVKQIVAAYCTGIKTSSPVDVTDDKSGSDTSPTTDALVVTQASEWIVAGFVYANTDGFTPGAGYTELAEQGSSAIKLAVVSRVISAVASYTPNGTLVTSGNWVGAAVALKVGS